MACVLAVVSPLQLVASSGVILVEPLNLVPTPAAYATDTNLYESDNSRFVYTGSWSDTQDASASGGSYRTTNATGSTTFGFDGTGFDLIATTGPASGIMTVSVDGGAAVNVDLYSASIQYQQTVHSVSGLINKRHTVAVSWTGTKNALSTSTAVNVDAALITGVLAAKTVYAAGTLTTNATWYADCVYVVTGGFTIGSTGSLTIQPGTVIKYQSSASLLSVSGTLTAVGTPTEHIYFTSLKDDTHGGDTNNDGSASAPAVRNWRHVLLGTGADNSRLEHVEITYAGASYTPSGQLYPVYPAALEVKSSPVLSSLTVKDNGNAGIEVSGASAAPAISGSTIEYNGTAGVDYLTGGGGTLQDCTVRGNSPGVRISASSPSISGGAVTSNTSAGIDASSGGTPILSGTSVTGNGGAGIILTSCDAVVTGVTCTANAGPAIRIKDNASPSITGLSASNNTANAIALTGSRTTSTPHTLVRQSVPYLVEGLYSLGSVAQLTIQPGTVVKFQNNLARLSVSGTLTAVGTPTEHIYFTSLKDDTHGGDTNNDGSASAPAVRNWRHVLLGTGADNSRLEHVEITESRRVSRRLHRLRGWGHGQTNALPSRST